MRARFERWQATFVSLAHNKGIIDTVLIAGSWIGSITRSLATIIIITAINLTDIPILLFPGGQEILMNKSIRKLFRDEVLSSWLYRGLVIVLWSWRHRGCRGKSIKRQIDASQWTIAETESEGRSLLDKRRVICKPSEMMLLFNSVINKVI